MRHSERAVPIFLPDPLQLREDAYAFYIDATSMLASIELRNGTILHGNRALARAMWVTELGLSGERLRRLFADPSRPKWDSLLYKLGRGRPILARDLLLQARDGDELEVVVSATPVRGPDGTWSHARICIEDVSQRRKLEEQLLQSQKLEALGRLAGGVAHDFNNLITVIRSHVELALEEERLPDPVTEDLEQVLQTVELAGKLTHQLLVFSRRQLSQPRVVDLSEIVASSHNMLSRLVGEDVRIVVELQGTTWPVLIDPGQFEQILLNLAVNGRDAMPGGGELRIGISNRGGYDTGEGPSDYVRISVSDTGSGMPEEIRQRIFEPFFTTKPAGTGTGLGLSTCYGIISMAGGSIEVESEIGRGSTFDIYLPRANADAVAEHLPRKRMGSAPRGEETILLVEDNDPVRTLTARILGDAGYCVLQAEDGQVALERYGTAEFDLLLTDVIMPRLGGRELAEAISTRRPGVPVLYVSGYTDQALADKGVLGAQINLLTKPFRPSDLLEEVRRILDSATANVRSA